MSPLTLTVLFGLSMAAAAFSPGEAAVKRWHFTVLLNGKPIGAHDFTVTRVEDGEIVDTVAHFKVSAAFIPVYRYDHRDHEVWRDGCLMSIASNTDDNGTKLSVRGDKLPQGFQVRTTHGASLLPDCISTFAYWDRRFLARPRLLNSQTGEWLAVNVSEEGAQHYSLTASNLAIKLSYTAAGEWLDLQSTLAHGRVLRYENR